MLELGIFVVAMVAGYWISRKLKPRATEAVHRWAFSVAASRWEEAGWVPLSYEHTEHQHRLTFRWHDGTQTEVLEMDDD